jgi:hypothetical protein
MFGLSKSITAELLFLARFYSQHPLRFGSGEIWRAEMERDKVGRTDDS